MSAHQMQATKDVCKTLWTAMLQLRTPDAVLKQQLQDALSAPSTVRGMLVALRLLLLNKLQQAAAAGVAVEPDLEHLAQLVAAACSEDQRLQNITSSSSSSRCQPHSLRMALPQQRLQHART
jgi:hypothetical protein